MKNRKPHMLLVVKLCVVVAAILGVEVGTGFEVPDGFIWDE